MARDERPSLRFGRRETRRLIIALLLSLLVHFLGWSGYEYGKKTGFWDRLHALLTWHKPHKPNPALEAKKPEMQQPTVFVEVSQPDEAPTKETIYYSSQNARAANPDANKDVNQPKIDGKQTEVVKTEDVPKVSQLHPSPTQPPAPPTPKKEEPQQQQASSQNMGDQKLAKVEKTETPDETPQPKPRPRTLNEARAQQHQPMPGVRMRQDGGTSRVRIVPSFDTKATAFGDYDARLIAAVSQYWYDELDRNHFAYDRSGMVVVSFDLHYDGTVDGVEIIDNNVGTLLGSFCQEAIDQTAPFGKWPTDMLHEIGSTKRNVKFTFFY